MPGLADTEREAYKAHIKSLEEQLAWFRQINTAHVAAPLQGPNGPAMEAGKLYDSEEEADAQELYDEGIIDEDELRSMLDAAGALHTEVDFHPTP